MNLPDIITDEIKRLTAKKAVRLKFSRQKNVSPLVSKLGGVAYWDNKISYPVDSAGNKMLLLLQLNLSEINFETSLPGCGMLQFFIAADSKTECKVIFHRKIKPDSLDSKGSIKSMPCKDFSPVLKECRVEFEEYEDYICVNDNAFDSILKTAYKNVTDREIADALFYELKNSVAFGKAFTGKGSKLFGHPCFLQSDVREKDSSQLLLLQIDSDSKLTMWGDYGAGNFFIDEEDLKNRDFTKVLYSWDCY